ncbi:MAG TPA: hypothetical protein VE934_14900 [Polaromonas sp.]|uniref:hypothetical protein n=1 Tax=Polaromonas sp. TaxID=1869339 RepID=UPI002D57412B|nr:hypothetical protein [Polaromonas sp.]HYW58241.1 hypothetical protein [Polaromonas sp.]
MLFLRWIVLLMLLTSAVSFVLFMTTGQARFKVFGLTVLRWTLGAAFVFFAVLAFEQA